MAGLVINVQFVIEDGTEVKVFCLQAGTAPLPSTEVLRDVLDGMGRVILKTAVAQTNMLAKVITHPDDTEDDDD